MTTIDRLREIAEREAREHLRDFWRVNLVECYGETLTDAEIDEVLRMVRTDARIPAPPRIIRTRDELADLDGDTLLFPAYQFGDGWESCSQKCAFRAADAYRLDLTFHGPAVVLATEDQVRAARRALEEA